MRIGIIGAGLAGLSAGLDLARAGHQVVICEQGAETGGLAGTFPYGGTRLETFYHHAFTTDRETIQLIHELGLGDKLLWRETPMGIFQLGRVMKFASPWDLLRFTPLSFVNRLRFGLAVLYLSRVKQWQKYERVRVKDWIQRVFGQQAWDVIWGPLLHGKFGEYAAEIGMPWFYSRIHTRAGSREKGMTKESLGYLEGSFQVLHDALARAIGEAGGSVRCGEKVQAVRISRGRLVGWKTSRRSERLDAVLATQAPPALLGILPAGLKGEYWERLRGVTYLGNICAVLTVKRSYSPIYWMNIPDVKSPFIAVIEHTNFIDKRTYGGRHTLYLSNYLPISHPRYRAADREVLREFYAYLAKVLPAFSAKDVTEARVFRTPHAQPVIRAGYSSSLVPHTSPVPGLYLANMAQIYPEDRGMSYSIRLGRRAAKRVQSYVPSAASNGRAAAKQAAGKKSSRAVAKPATVKIKIKLKK